MRPGREMDTRIAKEIFQHEVWATNKMVHERTPLGKQPLKRYSKDMDAAWEVAEKVRITLLPIEDGQWFAFSAPGPGWKSPQEFAELLASGNFNQCGAAVGPEAAGVICEAALRAIDKRQAGVPAESAPNAESTENEHLH